MKNISLIGTASYNNTQYPFHYMDGFLQLFPPNEEERKQQVKSMYDSIKNLKDFVPPQEWIKPLEISARTNDGNNLIFGTLDFHSNDYGYPGYEIHFIYQYDGEFAAAPVKMDHIYLKFQELDFFYAKSSIIPVYESGKITAYRKRPVKKQRLAEYEYQGIRISIDLHTETKSSYGGGVSVMSNSWLCITTAKTVDYHMMLQLIEHSRMFFCFLTRRKNIVFEDIRTKKVRGSKQADRIPYTGRLDLVKQKSEKENDERWKREIIFFRLMNKDIASRLFQDIADKRLYLEHLPESIESVHTNTIPGMITEFAAFEREFRNTYGQTKKFRSEEFYRIKEEISADLYSKAELHTGKTKKYYREIARNVENTDGNLEGKFAYACKDCEEAMTRAWQQQFGDSADWTASASRLGHLRNAFAHGNLDIKIMPEMISDLYVLRQLNYAMVLKRCGMRMDTIVQALKNLYS